MYSWLQKLSQIEKETGICKCLLEVMATFVAIQAVVKNGLHCTYIAVAATTAPCSLQQQYKELDLDLEQ